MTTARSAPLTSGCLSAAAKKSTSGTATWALLAILAATALLASAGESPVNDQAHSRERVFGIGPGFKYKLDTWSLYFNSYYETGAENRPEGAKLVFRISKLF